MCKFFNAIIKYINKTKKDIFVSNKWTVKKHQWIKKSKIVIISFLTFLSVFYFAFIKSAASAMGGSYVWTGGTSPKPILPVHVSKYIPFFGNSHAPLNSMPYIIFLIFIVLGVGILISFITPFWRARKINHVKASYLLFTIFISVLTLLALVYTILLGSDPSLSSDALFYLMLLMFLCYLPVLFSCLICLFIVKPISSDLVVTKVTLTKKISKAVQVNNIEEIFRNIKKPDHWVSDGNIVTDTSDFIDYKQVKRTDFKTRILFMRGKRREAIFRSAGLWTTLLFVCVPCVIQQLIYTSYLFVDKVIAIKFAPHAYVSWGLDHNGIVDNINLATRYASVISTGLIAFTLLVALSSSILFAYAYGRRNANEASKVVGNSITNSIIVSIIVVVFGFLLTPTLIKFQQGANANSNSIDFRMALWFVRILFLCFPLQMFSTLLTTYIRTQGKAVATTCILLITVILKCWN